MPGPARAYPDGVSRRRRSGGGPAVSIILVLAAVVIAVLWTVGGSPRATGAAPASPRPAVTADAGLLTTIASLPAAPSEPVDGYERDLFGKGWKDPDRNGCDARNDVLARDLADTTFKGGTHDCVVLTGTLQDPYTGTTIRFQRGNDTSELVQIDHIVPLSWAWQHGAAFWSGDERTQFANDQLNLLAVDGPTNSAKSDSGPADWLPPDADYSCEYAERFTAVLVTYALGIDDADRSALSAVAAQCG
ncbi:MAG: endonuclease [Naasia sp.]|nr:endonuclease [Naasia sp.]